MGRSRYRWRYGGAEPKTVWTWNAIGNVRAPGRLMRTPEPSGNFSTI